MFYTNESVYCPKCEPQLRRDLRVGVVLDCIGKNYSGTSTDVGFCPECHKTFLISYKVDTITEFK